MSPIARTPTVVSDRNDINRPVGENLVNKMIREIFDTNPPEPSSGLRMSRRVRSNPNDGIPNPGVELLGRVS
jgi:hypothetical protein